jgi:hypothetical protein
VRAVGIKSIWPFGTPTSASVYTAIFAAGLAIDGRSKYQRIVEWDEAFASLRENSRNTNDDGTSEKIEEQSESGVDTVQNEIQAIALEDVIATDDESINELLGYVPLDQVWPGGVDWALLHELVGMELLEDLRTEAPKVERNIEALPEDWWQLLPVDSRFPGTQALDWKANTGNFVRHHLPPQSLWSHNHVRVKALRRRHSPKKILVQEVAMGILIASFLDPARAMSLPTFYRVMFAPPLREYYNLGDLEIASLRVDSKNKLAKLQAELPSDLRYHKLAFIRHRIGQMRGFPSPRYIQDSDGEFYEICKAMNASIKDIFEEADTPSDEHIALALYKVAHNLFVSSAPPDVHTFNILLTGLKRWSRPELVSEVIRTLNACKIRPNEITCGVILDHYTQINDATEFANFVGKLRGLSKALMLARPDIDINEAGQRRLIRNTRGKVLQKVYPTPIVFNALMKGVLHFSGVDRALEVYYDMKEDGWGLDVLGLTSLLVDCVLHSDWSNGLYIWEEIDSIKGRAQMSHVAKAYSNMMSLCTITGNTAAYNHFLKEITIWSKQIAERGLGTIEPSWIIKAAISLVESVRKERDDNAPTKADPTPATPAWTADNVLIAMSGYMNHNAVRDGSKPTELARSEKMREERKRKQPLFGPNSEPIATKSQDEIWEDWLHQELGRKRAESAAQDLATGPFDRKTCASDTQKGESGSWGAWLSHELGLQTGKGASAEQIKNRALDKGTSGQMEEAPEQQGENPVTLQGTMSTKISVVNSNDQDIEKRVGRIPLRKMSSKRFLGPHASHRE